MIPLFILLGLGFAAITAYEFVPKAHAWADEHVDALRTALGAHSEAEAHVADAQAALKAASVAGGLATMSAQPPDPWAQTAPSTAAPADPTSLAAHGAALLKRAWESLQAATAANARAGGATADMGKTAQTPPQKVTTAQSANVVESRDKTIKDMQAALANLGVGQCGVRSYARVTAAVKDQLLAKLHGKGMIVTGANPWDIDTHKYGVKLRAVWDSRAQELKLIVTMGKGTTVIPLVKEVACEDIWNEIDPIVKAAIGT